MIDKPELKRCPNPWCASTTAPIPVKSTYADDAWRLRCACGVTTYRCDTEAEAIAAWNTRAQPDASALVEAAKGLASDVQCLIECRSDCGEWGAECPLQDADKPDNTIERLQRLLDALAAWEGTPR